MSITVTLVYSPAARQVVEQTLELAPGATAGDALKAAHLNLDAAIGIWGKQVFIDQVLKMHDRLEIYRPLRVDPKTARRERFAQQGAKKSGLFAKRRAGGKAGY